MINPQTQSNLYGFDMNDTRSPGMILLPVCVDQYNIIVEFFIIDIESPHVMILGRPWIHMMKAVPSSYHQLLRYSTPTETADIRGDQAESLIQILNSTYVDKYFGGCNHPCKDYLRSYSSLQHEELLKPVARPLLDDTIPMIHGFCYAIRLFLCLKC